MASFPHRVDASGYAANTTLVKPTAPDEDTLLNAFYTSMWPAGWLALLGSKTRARLLEQVESL